MSRPDNSNSGERVVMTAQDIAAAIDRIARDIVAAHDTPDSIALLGILRRGRPLADRIAGRIHEISGEHPRVGSLATTLYRDDLRSGKARAKIDAGHTHFDFDVDGISVVLVDDVLASGRTVRAALDEVMDYGRPERIQLACLVDRGLRELPIQADYLGQLVPTDKGDHVAVRLNEADGEDIVFLRAPGEPAQG